MDLKFILNYNICKECKTKVERKTEEPALILQCIKAAWFIQEHFNFVWKPNFTDTLLLSLFEIYISWFTGLQRATKTRIYSINICITFGTLEVTEKQKKSSKCFYWYEKTWYYVLMFHNFFSRSVKTTKA